MNSYSDQGQPVSTTMASVIYVLYLVSIVFNFLSIVGVIIAYVSFKRDGSWLDSHYSFQISTFWIGLVYSIVAFVLFYSGYGSGTDVAIVPLGIGVLVGLFILIWLIVRCVSGLSALNRQEAIANPDRWGF